MMAHFYLLFLIATASVWQTTVLADDGEEEQCVRLTSAFNYDGDVYLVSGNEYFLIDSSFVEIEHGTLEDEFYAPDGTIDAALSYDDDLYFFKGLYSYSYDYLYYFGTTGAATDISERGEFFEFGLDAAATLGDTSYFFHGCEYAKGNDEYEFGNMKDLGLPCYVDAAWSHDNIMYIVLENDVWTMDESETVTGPEALSSLVTLTTKAICANDPYLAAIRAEQSYENKHDCVIIDAAITWDDTVYLFNDDKYITLDDNGNETEIDGIYEWGGLRGNVDAGIVFAGDDDTYFFEGEYYYKYFYGFLHNIALGPRTNSYWGPFFEQGIDAAGNHNGDSYFFNGCSVLLYKGFENEGNLVIRLEDLNLPCDVDAAYSRDNSLYVIKRNQVWTWSAEDEVASEPEDLSTAITIRSWTACPAEDE